MLSRQGIIPYEFAPLYPMAKKYPKSATGATIILSEGQAAHFKTKHTRLHALFETAYKKCFLSAQPALVYLFRGRKCGENQFINAERPEFSQPTNASFKTHYPHGLLRFLVWA